MTSDHPSDAHGISDASRTDERLDIGDNAEIDSDVLLAYQYSSDAGPTFIGEDARIRSGSIVYADVKIGAGLSTGHNTLIREHSTIGTNCVIGTASILDGNLVLGSNVSIQTGVYIPPETEIGDDVFVGPRAVLTNDPYPLRVDRELEGPIIEDNVSIGANSTILPGVSIGKGSFIAAGAVVTADVPPRTLVVGVPGEEKRLPDKLSGSNSSQ